MLVFDITFRKSFNLLAEWMKEIETVSEQLHVYLHVTQ